MTVSTKSGFFIHGCSPSNVAGRRRLLSQGYRDGQIILSVWTVSRVRENCSRTTRWTGRGRGVTERNLGSSWSVISWKTNWFPRPQISRNRGV